MQRYLRLGMSRVQLLEAVAHDPRAAQDVVATLAALRPARVLVDLSPGEWRLLRHDPDAVPPFSAATYDAVAAAGPAAPHALHRAVAAWAEQAGTPLQLLLSEDEAPPEGRRWWRPNGLALLSRLVRREGFEASSAAAAVDRLHLHYVARVPDLQAWLDRRRRRLARGLVAAQSGRHEDAAAVLSRPDADPVADEAYRLTHPQPS